MTTMPGQEFPIDTLLHQFHSSNLSTISPRYRTLDRCLANFRAKGQTESLSLASNLQMFLVAWGFAKESDLVLPSDSKRLVPMVNIILDPIYTPLRDSSAAQLGDPTIQRLLLKAASLLSEAYRTHIQIHAWNTDELTTHLLNATFGSICPFGTAQRKGIRMLNVGPDSLSVQAMGALSEFYVAKATMFDTFKKELTKAGHAYTDMTILGFYLWQVGNCRLGV